MKVKSEAQFFFCDIYLIPQDLPRKCLGQSQSVPIGAVRASDKPNPAGEALKKARTTEIPQDSCCPSLGWVKSTPIRAVGGNDSAWKNFGLILSPAGSPSASHHLSPTSEQVSNFLILNFIVLICRYQTDISQILRKFAPQKTKDIIG